MENRLILLLSALLQQFRDQPGPPGLVAGADARAAIPMKILVEVNHVAPVGIALKFLCPSEYRPPAVCTTQKDMREPPRDFSGHLAEVHHLARACRTLDLEAIAEIVMKLLQRLNDQIVERKPDGTAPI